MRALMVAVVFALSCGCGGGGGGGGQNEECDECDSATLYYDADDDADVAFLEKCNYVSGEWVLRVPYDSTIETMPDLGCLSEIEYISIMGSTLADISSLFALDHIGEIYIVGNPSLDVCDFLEEMSGDIDAACVYNNGSDCEDTSGCVN